MSEEGRRITDGGRSKHRFKELRVPFTIFCFNSLTFKRSILIAYLVLYALSAPLVANFESRYRGQCQFLLRCI